MGEFEVVSHPDPESFNHAMAAAVLGAWSSYDFEIEYHDLHAEGFDPIMSVDEARRRPSSDPRVLAHIEALRSAKLLAVIHPNCWGSPPAMMKGWIDRVFAPGAAYEFAKGVDTGDTPLGLLTLKEALVLNTGNTLHEREQDFFQDPPDATWRGCILEYCGARRVTRRLFAVVATSDAERRQTWLRQIEVLAHEAAGRLNDV